MAQMMKRLAVLGFDGLTPAFASVMPLPAQALRKPYGTSFSTMSLNGFAHTLLTPFRAVGGHPRIRAVYVSLECAIYGGLSRTARNGFDSRWRYYVGESRSVVFETPRASRPRSITGIRQIRHQTARSRS
jgi:hypothetical protein